MLNCLLCLCVHTSRFSGLMSRWTMFIRCRYLMAPARLNTMALASRSLYFVDEVMASKRSPPWKEAEPWTKEQEAQTGNRRGRWRGGTLTSSMTKNSWLGVSSTSINWMMLGCRTLRNTATSFSIRCSYEDTQNDTITSKSLISPELHSHLCKLFRWSRNAWSNLTFPQQRALSMIFRAYSCPVDLSVKQIWTILHQAALYKLLSISCFRITTNTDQLK